MSDSEIISLNQLLEEDIVPMPVHTISPISGHTHLIKGDRGDRGLRGYTGDTGKPFVFADLTPAQKEAIRGAPGQDATDSQVLKLLKGLKDQLIGPVGEKGTDGKNLVFKDLSPEEVRILKGPRGLKGTDGVRGPIGPSGPEGKRGADGVVDNALVEDSLKQILPWLRKNKTKTPVIDIEEIKDLNMGKRYLRVHYANGKSKDVDITVALGVRTVTSNTPAVGAATDAQVIHLASTAGASFVYIGNVLDRIDYLDYDGVTSHTKQLTYTSGNLTKTTEIFTYESQVWTVVIDFTYTGDTLTSKTNPIIVKV